MIIFKDEFYTKKQYSVLGKSILRNVNAEYISGRFGK